MSERLDTTPKMERVADWVPNIKVALFDFDNTAANTFEKSPAGIDVSAAYEAAVSEVFDADALRAYKERGGLRNRHPGEVVQEILETAADRKALLSHARAYLEQHREELERVMQEGKGVTLDWNEADPLPILTELLVRAKLLVLLQAIGEHDVNGEKKQWPEPMPGFLAFLAVLRDRGVRVAILSAGHDEFIRKAFNLWGAPCPLLVSDDRLRPIDIPEADKVKPHEFLAHLAHSLVIADEGRRDMPDRKRVLAHPNEIGYFGDDDARDGELARRAKMRFGWYRPNPAGDEARNPDVFTDWDALARTLRGT